MTLGHTGAVATAVDLPSDFVQNSQRFLQYLDDWYRALPVLSLADDWRARDVDSARTAVCSVDVINGFCCEGPLASPRVGLIVPSIVRLFDLTYTAGVRNYVLTQDTHPADAAEFAEWPPHCIAGTAESRTVDELLASPAARHFRVMPKNSINSSIGTDLDAWLDSNRDVTEFIAVGDCSDLCLHQLAMGLKLRSNALGLGYQITVPADCVETYDLPIEVAKDVGAPAHDGDFFHVSFLYHLALNGVRVVARLDP